MYHCGFIHTHSFFPNHDCVYHKNLAFNFYWISILSAMGLFLIWTIISRFFTLFFCMFLYTIRTGFFCWSQCNPLFLNLKKTDWDMSHFVQLPTVFQVYSSLGINFWTPKFNAQRGINCFQTLFHSWKGWEQLRSLAQISGFSHSQLSFYHTGFFKWLTGSYQMGLTSFL